MRRNMNTSIPGGPSAESRTSITVAAGRISTAEGSKGSDTIDDGTRPPSTTRSRHASAPLAYRGAP